MARSLLPLLLSLFVAAFIGTCAAQCRSQADCYSPDITTSYRPLLPSLIRCQGGECICNECFEKRNRIFFYDYCGVSQTCYQFVNYNSTLQTCQRNFEGDRLDEKYRAPTGILLGLGCGGCIILALVNIFGWKWLGEKWAFFENGTAFTTAFSMIYFITMGVIFVICGISVGIAWGVLRSQQCLTESDDDDYDSSYNSYNSF